MTRMFVAIAAGVLAASTEAAAHRLDEFLQASRVSLDRDRITLEVDLTPGAGVASPIVSLLDADADGAISPIEAGAYGQRVLNQISISLDGRAVAMTLVRVEAPSIGEMQDGMGTVRLSAAGVVRSVGAGRRQLALRNTYEPTSSVYLANALVSDDGDVVVVRQERDPRQQELRVEYDVASGRSVQLGWLALTSAALGGLAVCRGRARSVIRRPAHSEVDS